MKKILKYMVQLIIICMLLMLPFIDITRPFHGIMLEQAKGKEALYPIYKLENADALEELVVIPEKVQNANELIRMLKRINSIDRPILDLLMDQGVKIRLFEGSLTDEPLLYYLKWDKPRGWKENVTWEDVPGAGGGWLVSAKIGASVSGNGHGSINLELHEIGHTVYHLMNTSQKHHQNIRKLWKKEVSLLFPGQDYFATYTSEYFAEAFAYYYCNESSRKKLQQFAPKTYQFFQQFHSMDFSNLDPYFFR
ncbi:toxin [Radiobacillus kanasensis]|uniref:anthrax toxin lethal factor-related metalloendopeptidase n=1 Tax=Radiobacillus kanasensis TaxID=2844358 RepID=UPI001E432E0A|nr:toxin [Radiobacillus kanasensis]UFU01253.1 toxin [Radiobacillus kanasensis]